MKLKNTSIAVFVLLILLLTGCPFQKTELSLDYDKYTLDNGLEVILHEDKSDPIVAVSIMYHAGSGREEIGKTGFAHLFEHIMFQESQHVPADQFFQKIQSAGGTLNGGTWEDGTIYYEVVPNNALEMVLWLESDRMGYLLSSLTYEAFANQQEVVMNEKRERYDNQPYGQTYYVINKLLYPEGHPYNWQTIGSMDDIANANLRDVHDFFRKWYGPNNATLVIAGDYDKDQTMAWIEKYFGEILRGTAVAEPIPQPVKLEGSKRYFYEDNFASSPELNMVFPTVEASHKDQYALDFLAELLSDGKKAPLYQVIVEEEKLAPSVGTFQSSSEMAGEFIIRVRAFPATSLTAVETAINSALRRFAEVGFTDADVERIKARTETRFYNNISSVLNKAFQLTQYNEFNGSPDFIKQDLKNILAVSSDDIRRVYDTYIKDRPSVLTSFVPAGKTDLVAANSQPFVIAAESLTAMTTAGEAEMDELLIEPAPSSFDRSIEPTKAADPTLTTPTVWKHTCTNNLRIYGIEQNELPLVNFTLTINGGMLLDDPGKIGVANLMTDIMQEGTRSKTPLELEEAIDELGSSIGMFTSREAIVITANTLASKFTETFALAEEMLLEPRWDEKEFARIKQQTIESINRNASQPRRIADDVFNQLVYGNDHIFSNSTLGSVESVESITIDDLKAFYANYFAPNISYLNIAGAVTRDQTIKVFSTLENRWPEKRVDFPDYQLPEQPDRAQIYFIDVPGARQSEIRIGYPALPATAEDYYAANVMNYDLGGSFNGILNMILREEKGFTYGARSGFSGSLYSGVFRAYASVQADATAESVTIFHDEMARFREPIALEDLEFTKQALIKSNARRFETLSALLSMLNSIAKYGYDDDYVKQNEKVVKDMTIAEHNVLAQKYILPDKMIYLVVGDAATQLESLRALDLGDPILLDKKGNKINI